MSKRRNRKGTQQNIPQDILERARQQIAQNAAESDEDNEAEAPEITAAPQAGVAPEREQQPYKARPRRREGLQPARLGEKQVDLRKPQVVQKMLANPTRVVTEDQLRQEYGYVLADLKSMGLLAAGLIVALIVVAQVL